MKKVIYIVTACVLLIGCKTETANREREAIPIDIQVVETHTSAGSRTYIGKAEPSQTVAVSAAHGGEITQIFVRQGERVEEGQPLLVLDTTQIAAALRTAEAMQAQAEDAYERAIAVYEGGGMSELQWKELLTNVEKARSTCIAARKELDYCFINAPQSGIVSDFKYHKGERVGINQRILSLLQTDGLHVRFQVAETDIANVSIGDEATVTIGALKDRMVIGKVTEKSVEANLLSHSYGVTVNIGTHKDILPGMLCKIRMQSTENEAIIIPQRIVHTRTDGPCVWMIKNGNVIRRTITVGNYTDTGIVVKDGLQTGDTLIVSGMDKLYTGAKVIL